MEDEGHLLTSKCAQIVPNQSITRLDNIANLLPTNTYIFGHFMRNSARIAKRFIQ